MTVAAAQNAPAPPETTVFVVVPAYNEEARIGQLLERIDRDLHAAGLTFRIVVVDDGSGDATPDIVNRLADRIPIDSQRHPQNLGLGSTIRDGLQRAVALAGPEDFIVTMDGDDTHPPALIARMVQALREGHDVVVASRYRPGSRVIGVPLFRRLLSYLGSGLLRLTFPIAGIRDYTNGYRAYRSDCLRQALAVYGERFLDQRGFQCMVDILLKLRPLGLVMGEVSLVLRYDRKQGQTKMQIGRTIRNTLLLIAKRRLSPVAQSRK
ncbi:MAG: glycosyltransferase [Candidatus Schekmanbacteria bacterium]|nr:glycosyltransferase [Candidatus Schekmanbacteria bacterium]